MSLKVLKKGKAPNGMGVLLENWHDKYYKVGCYPTATDNIYTVLLVNDPPFPKRGEPFRASFRFDSLEEANEAFEEILTGKKSYLSYLDYYDDGPIMKDGFLRAIRYGKEEK